MYKTLKEKTQDFIKNQKKISLKEAKRQFRGSKIQLGQDERSCYQWYEKKFTNWEFRGKPFFSKNRKWLKAKSKTFNKTWFYCFETDCIYDGIYSETEMSIV